MFIFRQIIICYGIPRLRLLIPYNGLQSSAAIRVAREIFAYLPVESARVNAISNMLNSSTGHLEDQPILSVLFVPETIGKLNLGTIDPSDSMQNFIHNIKFNKTKEFSVAARVEIEK